MHEHFEVKQLVYSDVEFISLKYEEITKESPTSQLTKMEGMKAGLGIPIVSAGVHTQETKSYQLSSLGMLNKIYSELIKYPAYDLENYKEIKKPTIVWVKGVITVSCWKKGEEKYDYFQLYSTPGKADFYLMMKPEYTNSGYDTLLNISPVVHDNIQIPVFALLKILYFTTTTKTYISTPYLIMEQ